MARMVRFEALWYAIVDRLVTASSVRWQLLAAITGWGLQLVATRVFYTCSETESWNEETLIWYNDVRYLAQFFGPIFVMILAHEARPFFPPVARAFPRWGPKTAAESQAPDVDDTDDDHPKGTLLTALEALENSEQEKSSLRSLLETLKTENENLREGISGRAERIRNLEQETDDLIQKNDHHRRAEAELIARINAVTMRNDILEPFELENEHLRNEINGMAVQIRDLLEQEKKDRREGQEISDERIDSLQAALVENSGDHLPDLVEGEELANTTPKAPIPIEEWAPISLMARFKGFTPAEKELTKLDWGLDPNRGVITAPASLGDLPGHLPTHAEHQYSGLMSILGIEANNDEVWQSLSPAFEMFTGGRPLCVLFDGYSGSGKTHTIFEGPTAVFPCIASGIFQFIDSSGERVKTSLQLQACAIDFDIVGGNLRKYCIENPRWLTDKSDGPITNKETLLQKVEAARQQRDRGHVRKTAQNTNSSRSHLVLKFLLQVRTPIPYKTSLCLVDLVGDEAEKDIHPEEKQKDLVLLEQKAIRESRNKLHSCLAQPDNITLLHTGKLMPQLKEYFSQDTPKQETPKQETPKQKQSMQGSHPLQPPLCIHFSMLSALERDANNTIKTLAFSQELRKAGGGGGGRRPRRVPRPASAEPRMPRPQSAG